MINIVRYEREGFFKEDVIYVYWKDSVCNYGYFVFFVELRILFFMNICFNEMVEFIKYLLILRISDLLCDWLIFYCYFLKVSFCRCYVSLKLYFLEIDLK